MAKAILYARFSPRRNADDCDSCEKQLADMREYCQKQRLDIAGEYEDRALSGSDAERPGLWDAIHALRRGQVLVVRNMDRLARDVLLCEMVLQEIRDKGARLVSLNGEGTHDDSPEATFIRQIFSAFAQYQREIIRQKTRASMRRHQQNGRRMSAADRTPFGWKSDPDNPTLLIEDDTEQTWIARICRWRRAGEGFRSIARKLADAGVPCRGGTWHHGTVKKILERAGVESDA